MIRRMVFYRLKKDLKERQQASDTLRARFEAAKEKLPGFLSLTFGVDCVGKENADCVAIMDFSDQASLDHYAEHDIHKEIIAYCQTIRDQSVIVDFPISDEQAARPMTGGIRHIVAWKFQPAAQGRTNKENAMEMKRRLEELAPRIQGALCMYVGVDSTPQGHYDGVLDSVFTDFEALHAYKVHPEHVEISAFCKSVREDRIAVDFEA